MKTVLRKVCKIKKLVNILFFVFGFRVRFFKNFQDWILKSERIRERILSLFITQINPRSLRSWCVKGTEESISQSGFFGSFDAP